jgi:hypothetical protein
MSDTITTELTPAEIEARRAAVEANQPAPQPEPAAEPAAKPRKPAKAGDGSVTVRARKVLPAKNPLKELEARVKPAAAPKPAAKPAAKPAKAKCARPVSAAGVDARPPRPLQILPQRNLP